MSHAIQTADLDWQTVDGIEIPVSKSFGDVYFSKDNGLLETRHVFLNGNNLSERLAQLQDYQYFCVGETGFGTGLNVLTLWQLWQQVRPDNHSHLHVISVEKFPLTKSDLIRALNAWPELAHFTEQLISQYPLPIAGCHRLHFPNERFSLDLWLGDAHDVFPTIVKTAPVNAWFLDGFAPACNPDMWEEQVLKHIVRLSDVGTTFASFSVAGVLKRGLKQYGVQITRPRGFGHKREMLKGILLATNEHDPCATNQDEQSLPSTSQPRQIAIIGAGIAGLSCAWAFAQRGHHVSLYDQSAPLAGASGNPLALLNPKLCPIEQTAEHLMTLSWQRALTHYSAFDAFRPIQVQQFAQKNPEELLSLVEQYPDHVLGNTIEDSSVLSSPIPSIQLANAGAVIPQRLADQILSHPLIHFEVLKIEGLQHLANHQIKLLSANDDITQCFDHVIICAARESKLFFNEFPVLKPIRGQVSWCDNSQYPLPHNQAYSYGGYCMQLDASQLILGASFYPGREDTEVLDEDHLHNLQLVTEVFPQYAAQLPTLSSWQGRASIRAQSLDYFPLVGRVDLKHEVYTFSGLGSKGFLFGPLCSEVLVAQVLQQACPIPQSLFKKLQPTRFTKKVKPKKLYFQQPMPE